ncbi:MAG: protein-L-isoaspartate O-methyltransferase [Patescibacteria group bacterium]|mgnify:CR=1 FL=1
MITERHPRLKAHLESSKEELRKLLLTRGSERVVEAMMQIPRECFMPAHRLRQAYEDLAIPLNEDPQSFSTISQPGVVAEMTTLLDPQPTDNVAEIGTASGYQAAVLARLCGHVTSFEISPILAASSSLRMAALAIENVDIVPGDFADLDHTSKFDKLIVTASIFPSLNLPIIGLVKEGGILVAPVGGIKGEITDCKMVKFRIGAGDTAIKERVLENTYSFVPLEGRFGWGNFIRTYIRLFHDKFFQEQSK